MTQAKPVYRCTACNLLSGGKPSDSLLEGKLKLHKCRTLNIKIQFKESIFTENYEMKVNTGFTVGELKGDIELLTGIPTMLQQVCFNDEAILYDNTYLHELNLVNNCTLSLTVRHDWAKLVEAVLQQDFDKLMTLGITEDSDFHSPSIDYIKDPERKKEALRFRATVALIIASHRGMARLVKQLIGCGIDVNGQTQFKRSALHIVAAKGQSEILDILIHNGANIDLVDYNNETPLDIANRLEQQQSSRQLFLFRWQLRAKNAQPSFADIPMFPHQYFDSDLTIHFNGSQGQVYMLHVPPLGEGDRWKPRKTPEVVTGIAPTRAVSAIERTESVSEKQQGGISSGKGAKSVASQPTDFLTTSVKPFANKKRPKSPAFAYEDGVAPVGNKKEGKKTFEEWLAEKKSGPPKPSSAFGSREGQRPATATPSTTSHLMPSHQDRITSASLVIRSEDNSNRQSLFRRKSIFPQTPFSQHGKNYKMITASLPNSQTAPTAYSEFPVAETGDKLRPLSTTFMIPASFEPIHDLVYKYQRVKSASECWARLDRGKCGYTVLWA